ncbi:hypothetical protein [Lactococcus lactis]|uniref:hypothetical protein n=1 Tax=Lactococcus lactis TaxID=1358 RepID=UPI0037CCC280
MKIAKLHKHVPTNRVAKIKYDIAEALNTICDLRHPDKFKELTEVERYELFNKSMISVCDALDIDLDMHELLKSGAEGFSYSDNNEDTQALKNILEIGNDDGSKDSVKSQVEDLCALNQSMFSENAKAIPRYTDGTPISTKDLADMNLQALENLLETLGIEPKEQ